MFYVILYESFVFIKENLKKKYLVSSSNKNSFYYFCCMEKYFEIYINYICIILKVFF